MCFVLYVGTEKSIPRKKWDKEAPDLCVESLSERDQPIKAHFSKSEVQYVGATSGCGCDFPHVTLQNGQWPIFDDDDDDDPEWEATDTYNRDALVKLLRSTEESEIEIYGIWDGDFQESPKVMEEISLQQILDKSFFFKEQGFYKIAI
ncbi:MAG: hypothetical protein ABIK92_16865 [Pseudomonadota bacterium]